MPCAEIITIGTEILLGEIVDTNSAYLARILRDLGVDLYRKTTVGDNAERIAQAIRQSLGRCDIIITTGGLGPTVDDPTREAVALAVDVENEFREELWEQVRARFRRFNRLPTENNRRQAYIPRGAIGVENPVGTAPAFIVEDERHAIIALPGVPREMEYLTQNAIVPYLRKRYKLSGIIKARILHTAGVGESQIDAQIGDLEASGNPTVGLAAHSGQVDIRITAKAASEKDADSLIGPFEQEIRKRLGDWIYGADGERLEEIALRRVSECGWTLTVLEAGLNGDLIRRLANSEGPFLGGELMTEVTSPENLCESTRALRAARAADVCLGAAVVQGKDRQEVHLALITPEGEQSVARPYGGPPEYAPRWAIHHGLDMLRRLGQ
jgi:competence/damage-inducible protein CinA-like protein